MLTVTLKHPPNEVRPNARVHWATKAKHVKMCRSSAFWSCKKAIQQNDGSVAPKSYGITWFYFGQVPDVDNCLASCKAYIDGCCDALHINDKQLECCYVSRMRDSDNRGLVEIAFFN